jgi:hypothetical protein
MRRFVEGIDREQATLFPEYARGCSRRRQECDCAQQYCEGAKAPAPTRQRTGLLSIIAVRGAHRLP